MSQVLITLEVAAMALGLGFAGMVMGTWVLARSARAQFEAQRVAFEQARTRASQDLEQALLCVPQWIHRAIRTELEMATHRQAARVDELLLEQRQWQSRQDALRHAEWSALVGRSPVAAPTAGTPPVAEAVPDAARASGRAGTSMAQGREFAHIPGPAVTPDKAAAQPSEAVDSACRQLSDAEIDALPPELPGPTRARRRGWTGPTQPVLRNI